MTKKAIQISLVLTFAAGLPAFGGEVSGQVVPKGRPGEAHVTTVVYLESLDGQTPVRSGHYRLDQKNKTFMPSVLAVPVGSTVDFPNDDRIFHNVFSVSPPAPFDLGLYRAGASKSRVFSAPAIYRVFCNIHSQMTAVILVLSTSYITEATPSGSYRIDVPAGKYRVTAWSERSQLASANIIVGAQPVTVPDIAIDESRFVAIPHRNKYGQPYPPSSTANYDPLKNEQ
jgi:plastocyanin